MSFRGGTLRKPAYRMRIVDAVLLDARFSFSMRRSDSTQDILCNEQEAPDIMIISSSDSAF